MNRNNYTRLVLSKRDIELIGASLEAAQRWVRPLPDSLIQMSDEEYGFIAETDVLLERLGKAVRKVQ